MIVLIVGASHTGKTAFAQRLLEKYKYPYLSLDLLKMGLIRSGYTSLTPMDDDQLVGYLWPVAREMIKTAIENQQDLAVEGCYIPFDWAEDFQETYLTEIRYVCLVMSERYIRNHFDTIKAYANVIERRLDDSDCTLQSVMKSNRKTLEECEKRQINYLLIDDEYEIDMQL